MNKYFISIVVGTFDHRWSALSHFSLNSLYQQQYPTKDYEVIVINNNNEGVHVPPELKAKYPCRYVNEPTKGVCRMRNTGVDHAQGDIIAFIDDDCEVDPQWLERMNNFYQNPTVHFGGGNIFDIGFNRLLRDGNLPLNWTEDRNLLGGNMSFRKTLFQKYRFDENILYGNDEYELIFRILQDGYQYFFDETPIKHHRVHSPYRKKGNSHLSKFGRKIQKDAATYYEIKKKLYRYFLSQRPRHLRSIFSSYWSEYFSERNLRYCALSLKARYQIYQDLQRLNS